ncbi:MAG TPA: SDR family NAD(P)-dependent oxidoreductase [Bacteroidales bacterium]|nr:SDR family NAD(P)-dependent oxidoreductase [Bacteroidales bacterium]
MRKVAIVTGANGGIGKEITRGLLLAGYEVIMACQNLARSEPVRQELDTETGGNAILMPLDLGSITSIRAFVEQIESQSLSIDLLFNNAGVIPPHSKTTTNGIEYSMGVNYLGPYLLTQLIIPHMPPGGRIINTCSLVYKYGKISPDLFKPINPKLYGPIRVYSNSKLAVYLGMLNLIPVCEEKGLLINSYEPGIVNTPILTMHHWLIDFLANLFFRPFVRTPRSGARPALYLALDPSIQSSGGLYSRTKRKMKPSEKIPKEWQQELKDYTELIINELKNKQ